MRVLRSPILASLALAMAALAVVPQDAQAQWQWRDAQGRVTVSDRPPPSDVPASAIISKPQAPAANANGASPSRPTPAAASGGTAMASHNAGAGKDPALEATRKKNMEEAAEKKRMEEEKTIIAKRDNCSRAKAQATAIEGGHRMSRLNDKGEREALDDKARGEELNRMREAMQSNCN